MAERIRVRLMNEGKITQEMIESYIEAYHRAYGDNFDAYAEEILADAYAAMERTEHATTPLRMDVWMETGQWTKKTGSARAPPEKTKYSIGRTTQNQPFVEVERDILAGVPEAKWASTVKENLKQKFPKGITLGNSEIKIDYQSRREMTFSRYMQWLYNNDPQMRADKLRATDNANEILKATTGWVNEGLNHPRKDDIREFARGEVLLRVGNKDYTADVVVGTRTNGAMMLYDVLNMQPTIFKEKETDAAITVNPSPEASRSTASISKDSISKNGESVKAKFSMSSPTERTKDFVAVHNKDWGTIRDAPLRMDVWTETGQWTKKTGSARAPLATKMSVSQNSEDSRTKTQNEITKQYQQSVHGILNGTDNSKEALLVGYTPQVYRKLGMPDLPFVVGSGHVYTMAKTAEEAKTDGKWRKGTNYHGLGESVVADIMEFVQNLVMVIAAKDVDNKTTPLRSTHSFVAMIDVGVGKDSMVIPVAITAERTVNGVRMDVNAISSAYERNATQLVNEAIAQFNSGENSIFYVKEEAANLLGAGVQFPEQLKAAASSDGIVRKFDAKINMSVKNVTQSQQFKRWFGDWQNHPERASKVVNADGTPKVLYHGTTAEFTVFDRSQGKKKIHLNVLGEGNYFTARRTGAERYGNRVVEAYLDIKNPYVFDNQNYNTTADQIAEDFGIDRTTFTGKDVTNILKERGYDGVILYDADGNVMIANAFNSNQIKSAMDNVGTFDKSNPDIRFSAAAQQAQEQQEKEATKSCRDVLPRKAAEYVKRLENRLVYELAENLSAPNARQTRQNLHEITEQALRAFFKTGEIDRAKMNELFEQAYQAGMEEDTAYYEQYKDIKDIIRDTTITISAQDKADIADFEAFRRAAFGTMKIGKDGRPADSFYEELQEMAPELFPAGITAPSDQLLRILDVARSIRKTEWTLDQYWGDQAASFKANQQARFSELVNRLVSGLRIADRYRKAQERAEKKLAVPQNAEEAAKLYPELKEARKAYEKVQNRQLLTEEDRKVVNRLLRGETTTEYARTLENGEAIVQAYEAKAEFDLIALRLKAWNVQRKQGLRDAAERALTEAEATKWVDKNAGIQYARETMERNVRDIARKGKVDDEKSNAFINRYFWPVHENESKRKNYLVRQQEEFCIRVLDADCIVPQINKVLSETVDIAQVNKLAKQELICKGWFLPPNTYDCGSFVVN